MTIEKQRKHISDQLKELSALWDDEARLLAVRIEKDKKGILLPYILVHFPNVETAAGELFTVTICGFELPVYVQDNSDYLEAMKKSLLDLAPPLSVDEALSMLREHSD